MKKSLKLLAIVAVMVAMLLALTGCGNKLVATKTTTEDGMTYEEKIEVSFKGDAVKSVKMTYTFDSEEMATTMSGFLGLLLLDENMQGMEIEQKGKEVIMELDAKAYAAMEGAESEEIKKEDLKKELEEAGYKVK